MTQPSTHPNSSCDAARISLNTVRIEGLVCTLTLGQTFTPPLFFFFFWQDLNFHFLILPELYRGTVKSYIDVFPVSHTQWYGIDNRR